MNGSWLGFVTALLTFLAVAWQGYTEYLRAHPPAIPIQQKADVPVYWNDGRHWYCKVGDQTYIWRPNTEGIACSTKSCKK